MWDWAHFKSEGWVSHTKRSSKLAGLLLLSGLAMALHMLVPFWQQPKWLSGQGVRNTLDSELRKIARKQAGLWR